MSASRAMPDARPKQLAALAARAAAATRAGNPAANPNSPAATPPSTAAVATTVPSATTTGGARCGITVNTAAKPSTTNPAARHSRRLTTRLAHRAPQGEHQRQHPQRLDRAQRPQR